MLRSWVSLIISFGLTPVGSYASSSASSLEPLVTKARGEKPGEDSGGGGKRPRTRARKILASDTTDLNYFQLFLIDENEDTYRARAGNLCILPQRNGDLEIHFFNATCENLKCTYKIRKTVHNPSDKILGCETTTPEVDKCSNYFEIQKSSLSNRTVLFSGKTLSIELNLCEDT